MTIQCMITLMKVHTHNVHLDEISDSEADSDEEIDGEQDASTEILNFEQQEDEHSL